MKTLFVLFLLFADVEVTPLSAETTSLTEKGNGRYKKKKHRLKKLLMGKRYCDCPKH